MGTLRARLMSRARPSTSTEIRMTPFGESPIRAMFLVFSKGRVYEVLCTRLNTDTRFPTAESLCYCQR